MNKSVMIAAVAVVALVLWMLSGQLGSKGNPDGTTVQSDTKNTSTAMKVQTRRQSAELITREIIIQGQVEPVKIVHMRAETGGVIKSVNASKGQWVTRGDIIGEISIDNRNAAVAVAKANEVQAANEYNAARKLQKQGLQSKTALESIAAKLEAARAQVNAAELEVNQTILRAPIDALIDDIYIEAGDFIDRGGNIATLVDNSQLLVTGQVPQQNVSDLQTGARAIAKLITGQTIEGEVQYISSMADTETRSFRVEVIIAAPPEGSVTGVSAEISLPVETLQAHLISPAILALDENGTLGIKAVNDSDEVVFHAIEVVKTQSDGAWVTGIPDDVNIITLGQGFVNPGEKVQAIPEPATSATNTPVDANMESSADPAVDKES